MKPVVISGIFLFVSFSVGVYIGWVLGYLRAWLVVEKQTGEILRRHNKKRDELNENFEA